MSARQVLLTADGLLKDGAKGFVAEFTQLLIDAPPPAGVLVQSATDVTRKRVRDRMPAATKPRLALTLRSSAADLVQPGARDGGVGLSVRYETFEANEDNLEFQVAYAASALTKCLLDNLRDYSDAHQGTVVDVATPVTFQFGEFDGPVSAGFVATISITERSAE